jgi:hypothetical protein
VTPQDEAALADAAQGVAALREAAARGLLLNNLFQCDKGRFHAAFKRRNGDSYDYFPFAQADTASEALRAALALAADKPAVAYDGEGSVLD